MEENNEITKIGTFVEIKKEKCLSNYFMINVKTPIKGFKPDKMLITLFDEINLPKLENYYNDFDTETLYKILNDYFFQLKDIVKKLEYIHINFENNMDPIILQGIDGLKNLQNFICKLNTFQTKNISNVNYMIKLLAKEEIFEIYNSEEIETTNDYLFIVLIRIDNDLYSYIFLLEKTFYPLNQIITFFKDRNIKYKHERIILRVLSKNLNTKIDYKDLSIKDYNIDALKIIENISSLEDINSCNFYFTKKVKLDKEDDLEQLINYLEQIQEKYYSNFDYFELKEGNITYLVIKNSDLFYLFLFESNIK